MRPPAAFTENHQTSPQQGSAGFLAPKYMAVLLVLILSATFYEFRSSTFIGDGLRHLPAFRTITEGTPVVFQPKPWLEVYRAHYDRVAAHHHFLFGLTIRAAFALQRALGIGGDAIIAMQAVNAISAAIAGGLFFLLVLRLGVPKWISLAVVAGVCLSPAYLLAATNVAEVALALPFFLGTLLVLADCEFQGRRAVLAGIFVGLAAITYLLAGSLVPCIAISVIASRSPSRSTIRTLFLFLSVFSLVFLGIWVVVLFLSGVHSPTSLALAILKFPEQGTYGAFKLGSLVATPIGLTQAFFPILPDDFRGLRSLYRQTPMVALVAGILSLITCAFLARAIYLLSKRRISRNVALFSSVLTFLLVEAVCFWFDPYYLKLQIFALILFWLIVAVGFTDSQTGRAHRWFLLLFVATVAACGVKALRTNIQPSRTNKNAQELHAIVGEGVLITGWSSDVAHLWLYSNGDNNIPLPDFALARNLQPNRVEEDLNTIINKAIADGTNVYFYGLFEDDDANLTDVYENRFRLTGFTSYLRGLQQNARPVGRFEQPGGHWSVLYVYNGNVSQSRSGHAGEFSSRLVTTTVRDFYKTFDTARPCREESSLHTLCDDSRTHSCR
jgi:hypothetical protein